MRGAPSERRTAISRRREAARESSSVATLAQAINRTSVKEPRKKVSRKRSRADGIEFEFREPGAIGGGDRSGASGMGPIFLPFQDVELGTHLTVRESRREASGQSEPQQSVVRESVAAGIHIGLRGVGKPDVRRGQPAGGEIRRHADDGHGAIVDARDAARQYGDRKRSAGARPFRRSPPPAPGPVRRNRRHRSGGRRWRGPALRRGRSCRRPRCRRCRRNRHRRSIAGK